MLQPKDDQKNENDTCKKEQKITRGKNTPAVSLNIKKNSSRSRGKLSDTINWHFTTIDFIGLWEQKRELSTFLFLSFYISLSPPLSLSLSLSRSISLETLLVKTFKENFNVFVIGYFKFRGRFIFFCLVYWPCLSIAWGCFYTKQDKKS